MVKSELLFGRIQGALYHFVTDFVKKEFLHQISYAVTEKTAGATRGTYIIVGGKLCTISAKSSWDADKLMHVIW